MLATILAISVKKLSTHRSGNAVLKGRNIRRSALRLDSKKEGLHCEPTTLGLPQDGHGGRGSRAVEEPSIENHRFFEGRILF